ncbi:hypothetical protein [Collimonas pratensis]|uniref:hypothetical protein n=1 Tax=Collimonas pratensis TaxID=279113 RepID=UPI00078465D5|nr:hypothetical protein [Collimonas pratensis]
MKLTKMNVTGQLDSQGAEKFASRIGVSYIIAAIGAASAVVRRLDVMKSARDLMQNSGPLIHTEVTKAMGGSWEKVQSLRQARNDSAFFMKP